MKNQFVSIIQPGIVGDLSSYWAMHFSAILEAMHQQKQLKFSFKRSIPDSVPQSISSLISNTPNGFFGQLKSSISNFGLQYFLCHYLMSPEGRPAVIALLNEVANAYNVDISVSSNLRSFDIFVCGIDSYSGHSFLQSTDAVIFGYTKHTIQNVWRDINYVDLCILIDRNDFPQKIAILGEVEGNNGAKLLRQSFWDAKSSFCSFGIGVGSNMRKQMDIQTFQTTTGLKSILTLSSNFSVVEDFKVAIDTLDVLFSMGASINIPLHDGMRSVVEIVRYHWNKPIDDLISQLRSMIQRSDSASIGPELIAMPSVPKIVQ
jgi:hypothetical protein